MLPASSAYDFQVSMTSLLEQNGAHCINAGWELTKGGWNGVRVFAIQHPNQITSVIDGSRFLYSKGAATSSRLLAITVSTLFSQAFSSSRTSLFSSGNPVLLAFMFCCFFPLLNRVCSEKANRAKSESWKKEDICYIKFFPHFREDLIGFDAYLTVSRRHNFPALVVASVPPFLSLSSVSLPGFIFYPFRFSRYLFAYSLLHSDCLSFLERGIPHPRSSHKSRPLYSPYGRAIRIGKGIGGRRNIENQGSPSSSNSNVLGCSLFPFLSLIPHVSILSGYAFLRRRTIVLFLLLFSP